MEDKKIKILINGEKKLVTKEELIKIYQEEAIKKFDQEIKKQDEETILKTEKRDEEAISETDKRDEEILKSIKEAAKTSYDMDYLTNGGVSEKALSMLSLLSTKKLIELTEEEKEGVYADEIKRILKKERGVRFEEDEERS